MNNTIYDTKTAILNRDTSLTDVLRHAQALAHQLSNTEFMEWVRQEQNGYQCGWRDLPDYRIYLVDSYANLHGLYHRQIHN